MKRYYFITTILCLFLISACGGSDDSKDSGLQGASDATESEAARTEPVDEDVVASSDETSVFANVQTVSANEFSFPSIETLDGQIFFVQGDMNADDLLGGTGGRIYQATFDGATPERMAERVYASTVTLTADKDYLIFNSAEGRRRYVFSLDLATGEVHNLIQLQSQFGILGTTSPDGEWMTMVPFQQGQLLARVDGTESMELGQGALFWTPDNQIIMAYIDNFIQFQNPNPPTLERIEQIDPLTGEAVALEVSFDPADPNLLNGGGLYNVLQEADIEVAPNFGIGTNFPGNFLFNEANFIIIQGLTPPQNALNTPAHCGVWQIGLGPDPNTPSQILVEVADTAFLTDTYFDGTAFYYQRWYFPDCRLAENNLHVDLERVEPGTAPTLVAADLYPGVDINLGFLRANNGRKYAISPDGLFAAWISGSLADRTTAINMTEIASGDTAKVFEWTSSDNNTFLATEAINAIFWVE